MHIRFSLLLCLLQLSFWCNAQDDVVYPNIQENIHLHLNKTTFIKGERLWFTAYVHDQLSKRPSVPTQNLHVAIYDQEGTKLKRKVFYTENGIAIGDFAIDSTFVDEEYLVVGYTNYMQNFEQLEPFRQRIKVIQDEGVKSLNSDTNTTINVYPEGGNLIGGAFNNFALYLKDAQSGSGIVQDKLTLVDDNGKVVRSNISTNEKGFGKVSFNYEENSTYFLEAMIKGGEMVRKQLPNPATEELGLHIDNSAKERLLLKMVASEALFKKKEGNTYALAIYQDGDLFYEDIEINRDKPVISLDRDRLPYGVNTAVLLNENLVPVAHRMFFNHGKSNNRVEHLEIGHCKVGDSIQIDLLLPDSNESAVLSASIMPFGTRAYNPDNSVISSFLLQPYLNGNVEELGRYFEDMDRRKRYELDLLFLVQGWGRYDWNSRTQKEVEIKYAFENGFKVSGKVLDANLAEEQQVTLITDQSRVMTYAELDGKKSFETNLRLLQGDSLGISLIGKKGKLRKAKFEIELLEGNDLSFFDATKYIEELRLLKRPLIDTETNLVQFDSNNMIIALDEVTVTERASKGKTDMFIASGGPTSSISEAKTVGDTEIKRYGSLINFLNTLGYKVSQSRDSDGFYVQILLSPKSNQPVAFSGNLNVPLSRVEAVLYDVDKRSFVSVVPRRGVYRTPEQRKTFVKFLIEVGYAQPQDYFDPGYMAYDALAFLGYGALDWKNRIPVNNNVPTSIRIPDFGLNRVEIFVEGMGNDGSLISQQKTIPTE